MPTPIISVENLSKRYLVGHRTERKGSYNYVALRDVLAQEMRNAARKAVDVVHGRQVMQGDSFEEFWALRDVSFEVQQGEVLGIIGRNGAGKSTLLKLLSRITEPTSGRITLRGRVASLLEVGTGFHPELTGRENIYLNGAVLGMSRTEIRKKFDEIVDFAEVERFLDTPVKRYSSGMYVRLAFAVAAHLEPEILIVDEVLAVGDAEFQKKCLGKMNEVSCKQGRTVLMVSHNMSSIAALANRAVLLEKGSIVLDGSVSGAISTYGSTETGRRTYETQVKTSLPHVRRIEIQTSDLHGVHHFGKPLEVKFWVAHERPLIRGCFSFQIVNAQEQPILHAAIYYPHQKIGQTSGTTLLSCRFSTLRLNVGKYSLKTYLSEPPGGELYEHLEGVAHFEVIRSDPSSPWGWRPDACAYFDDHEWQMLHAKAEALA